jgi:hypothetical protein
VPSGNKRKKSGATKKSPQKKSATKPRSGQTGNRFDEQAVARAKQEFQDLLAQAKGDTSAIIQENARVLEERLDEVRDEKLDADDFDFFVERQKRSLQIFIDSQPAQAQERAERLTIDLLEMAAEKILPLLIAAI